MRFFRPLLIPVLLIAVIFLACQKEIDFTSDPVNPGGGGQFTYGWSLKGNDTSNYYGCVDTAFVMTINPVKMLNIEGTDSAGNTFIIAVISPSGNITTGTYTATQGTASMIFENATNIYTSGPGASFSIQIASISDTLVTATFTGILTPSSGSGGNLKVTTGKIKARIGLTNPCGGSGGSGGGGGGGTGNAVYTLAGSPGSCSNANVQGNYIRSVILNSTNKVQLDVNVTTAGNWNISTTAVNGIQFSGSGSFSITGSQTIELAATGTPTLYGNNTIPVTAGSSNCSFIVPVDSIPAPACNPTNNTAALQGVNNITFTFVTGAPFGGHYRITANGSGGDMHLEFPGTAQPTAGVYDIELNLGDLNNGEVLMDFTASSIYWQPTATGKVFVTINNNKVTAVFCGIPISGTLGGPSFNSIATGRITEN